MKSQPRKRKVKGDLLIATDRDGRVHHIELPPQEIRVIEDDGTTRPLKEHEKGGTRKKSARSSKDAA
jgi:hypothetical protein